VAFNELIKSCGVGLLLASGLVQAPAATARPAAAAETLYLGFPQFDPVPEFSLVSVHPLPEGQGRPPQLALQLSYTGITFAAEAS